ncbi:precorrin-2 C(20)-methyltransferase [Suicoccus acidiformans]|uniref:Precorrin-2 C(20)-methyltransferase n=1 Tax=Suicoccus acidiformans TaxID=2036206 RepID=A0A347WM10_9LACT|nr:precorrin-2 C(20)-methyltransferase [Suicoccus acidiformans]AXY26117.1 precorrin-2 C(20)-methyltransferase [Suicoccus acidiformans]
MGKFYGIGVGPGDSSLITVKATEVLTQMDVIYCPTMFDNKDSLAYEIAKPYIQEDTIVKQHIFRAKDEESNEPFWQATAEEVAKDLDQGLNVGFITLGDPSTYSTYSYILHRLDEAYDVETIAGITSYNQIAATLNQSLALDTEAFCVVPATADEAIINNALEHYDTVVFLKIKNHLNKIFRALDATNRRADGVIISQVSQEKEKIIDDLTEFDISQRLSYFTTMIVSKQKGRY